MVYIDIRTKEKTKLSSNSPDFLITGKLHAVKCSAGLEKSTRPLTMTSTTWSRMNTNSEHLNVI